MEPTLEAVRIGHVNLSVSDLEPSRAFYRDVLNMKVTKRLDEAAFLSFGSYHHDLCINIWNSKGGVPRPKGTTGLFAVAYRDLRALQAACQRVRSVETRPLTVVGYRFKMRASAPW
jgi:catechol 2,3-dioxygenase